MKEEIYNEKQLKALEDEIRAMGIPYSENEPDERYFANFRVRLMERIDAKEQKQGNFVAAWAWLTSSPLRSLSLGATLAGVIVAVLLMRPVSEPQVATIQPTQQKIETPSVIIPKEIKPDVAVTVKPRNIEPKAFKNTNLPKNENRNSVLNEADKAADFASMDGALTGSESDDPVNLEKLSESELESVLTIAQEMK
jgi:hypothetical protein